jgi:hypothetical protein
MTTTAATTTATSTPLTTAATLTRGSDELDCTTAQNEVFDLFNYSFLSTKNYAK